MGRRFWTQITIDNRSSAYQHLTLWLEVTGVLAHVRQLRLADTHWERGTSSYAPAPGKHWFWHDGRLCRLQRSISDKARVGGANGSVAQIL